MNQHFFWIKKVNLGAQHHCQGKRSIRFTMANLPARTTRTGDSHRLTLIRLLLDEGSPQRTTGEDAPEVHSLLSSGMVWL
jgi:hypothetical protein